MAAVLDTVRAFFAPSTYTIDSETPADVVARENLLDRVMGPARRQKSSEKIRRGRLPADGLALVARDEDGHVIGTVRLWNIESGVTQQGTPVEALLLGPLAVDCTQEGRGIGGALMRAAISEAAQRGHGAVLLVGDAAYYERFGFSAEKTQHLVMPGPFERSR
ncbi:MAG TPA: N-acetyltransferase, partial [Pseudorhizobium sp.]|nr:N-acetyltransferase [Pseudorhizobium sp.]